MKEQPLSYEVFSSPVKGVELPYYDNFWIYFSTGFMADHFRTQPCFEGLKAENPDLATKLIEEISPLEKRNNETLGPFNPDLYKAYLIMYQYVDSNKELGISPPIRK